LKRRVIDMRFTFIQQRSETNALTRATAQPRRRGLSFPEVMISLAITAMLLVGVSSAFVASSAAINHNDEFFRATQAARISLNQITSEIRRADVVQVTTTQIDVQRPDEDLSAANEIYRRFSYDSVGKRLTLQIFYSGGTTSPLYTLARNVASASFGPAETGTDAAGLTVVARTPISLRVTVGKNSVSLAGAAGPRRALQ
jgi:hypothetical protein